MPIEFNPADRKKVGIKKVGIKKVLKKSESYIVPCPKCGKPYRKGRNYPNEVCGICVREAQ